MGWLVGNLADERATPYLGSEGDSCLVPRRQTLGGHDPSPTAEQQCEHHQARRQP
jgi:hypothetical protein